MERVLVGGCCGGNRFSVFNELALLFDSVFRVITGPSLMFALPLLPCDFLSPTLKFPICLSILANRPALSNVSISSNCEKMSAWKESSCVSLGFWIRWISKTIEKWSNLVFVRFQCNQYHYVCSIPHFCPNDYSLLWWSPRKSVWKQHFSLYHNVPVNFGNSVNSSLSQLVAKALRIAA